MPTTVDFLVSINGLEQIAARLAAIPDAIASSVIRTATPVMHDVIDDAASRAPINEGTLRNSITGNGVMVDRSDSSLRLYVGPGGDAEQYAAAQEYGAKEHWPPTLPILEWVRAKGLGGGATHKTVITPHGREQTVLVRHHHSSGKLLARIQASEAKREAEKAAGLHGLNHSEQHRRTVNSISSQYSAEERMVAFFIRRSQAMKGMKAHRYMVPAFDAHRDAIVQAVQAGVNQAVQES